MELIAFTLHLNHSSSSPTGSTPSLTSEAQSLKTPTPTALSHPISTTTGPLSSSASMSTPLLTSVVLFLKMLTPTLHSPPTYTTTGPMSNSAMRKTLGFLNTKVKPSRTTECSVMKSSETIESS